MYNAHPVFGGLKKIEEVRYTRRNMGALPLRRVIGRLVQIIDLRSLRKLCLFVGITTIEVPLDKVGRRYQSLTFRRKDKLSVY